MDVDATDRASIAAFIRAHPMGVVATTAADGRPEAALVGLAALEDGTLIFDAHLTARKIGNLRRNVRVAVVVGVTGEVSVQLEGSARIAEGVERYELGTAYNSQLPGSRALGEEFAVIAVSVEWVRVYDAGPVPPKITEADWGSAGSA